MDSAQAFATGFNSFAEDPVRGLKGVAGSLLNGVKKVANARSAKETSYYTVLIVGDVFGGKGLGKIGKFKGVNYHKNKINGRKNPAPKTGQVSLDKSVRIKETSSRRISAEGNSFVIFDETRSGVFHGHTRSWSELTQEMRNVLVKNKITNNKGKIHE